MRNLIPFCPKCGDCKVILAPLTHQTWGEVKLDPETMPVSCSQCDWRGKWVDVQYINK